jgi:hypothetical protein
MPDNQDRVTADVRVVGLQRAVARWRLRDIMWMDGGSAPVCKRRPLTLVRGEESRAVDGVYLCK